MIIELFLAEEEQAPFATSSSYAFTIFLSTHIFIAICQLFIIAGLQFMIFGIVFLTIILIAWFASVS
jgi:hypothetical protein